MDWFTTALSKGEEREWVIRNPEMTLGLLAYAVVAKVHGSSIEIKTKVRRVFGCFFSYACTQVLEETKEKRSIKGNMIVLNNIFMLIGQIKGEDAGMFYAPLMCEFITTPFSQEREKVAIKSRLFSMLFSDGLEQVSLGIFKTFAFLESRGEMVSDALIRTQRAKKEVLSRMVKYQNSHPNQVAFLSKMGIDKKFARAESSDGFEEDQIEIPLESTDRTAISEPVTQTQIKGAQHIKIFAEELDDLFNRKLLNRLEKEKETEVSKLLQYYERLSISSYKVSDPIPVKIIQYALVWNKSKNDLKKAAHPYLEKRSPNTPKFVPTLAAWCSIYENTNIDASIFDKTCGEIFLESVCFFMSIYTEKDKHTKWNWVGSIFKQFIRLSTFPGLSRIHSTHPWTLSIPEISNAYTEAQTQEVVHFYTSKLIRYKLPEKIADLNLEYEAYHQIKHLKPTKYLISLKTHIINSAHRKQIELENPPHPSIKLQVKDLLQHAHLTIKKYTENTPQVKEILKILLEEQNPPLELKDILNRVNYTQRIPFFLKILYILTLLETDINTLSNISHILSTSIKEIEKEEKED